MTIFVGSTNPVKINAVTIAASETWPESRIQGLNVPSGINDQPLSDEETQQGAINRAEAVLAAGLKTSPEEECLGVGLEGGVFEHPDGHMWSTVWVAVADQTGKIFVSNGARFPIPDVIAQYIRQGQELGPLIAHLVGEADVRSKQGMIGIITNNFVDRTEEYASICKMALGLYYGQGWDKDLANLEETK